MLDKKQIKFIEENLAKLRVEDIAWKLGMSPKRLKKELKALDLKPADKISETPAVEYKTASITRTNRKKIAACALLVLALTFSVYANNLRNGFVWDDDYLIVNNSQIKSFSHFGNVFGTYVGFGSGNVNNFYRPMQELSNMMDYSLWGERPAGYHFTSNLLHACVAVLVFILIFCLSDSIPVALLSGVFFGVHPIHTEAVTYIAGRADSLYSIFFLLSLIAFVRYADRAARRGAKIALLMMSYVFFSLSLLSKEISLVLPLVTALYVFIMLKGRMPSAMYRRIWYAWIPGPLLVGLYVFIRARILNFFKVGFPIDILKVPLPDRLLTFFKTVVVYIKLLIIPRDLHMERAIGAARSLFEPATFISFVFVACVLAGGVIIYKRNRLFSFFVFWYFINLLPVSGIFPINSFIAEHWLYMPSVGYFFILSALIYRVYEKYRSFMAARIAVGLFVAGSVAAYSFLTVQRNRDWKDDATFYANTIKYSPRNAKLYLNLGSVYSRRGEMDKALEQYEKVISLNDAGTLADAYGNIGVLYKDRGNWREAEEYLKRSIELNSNLPFAHGNLGFVYYKMGKIKEAIDEFETCIRQSPQQYQALNVLGEIYLKQGDKGKAVQAFTQSLQINPTQKDVQAALNSLR